MRRILVSFLPFGTTGGGEVLHCPWYCKTAPVLLLQGFLTEFPPHFVQHRGTSDGWKGAILSVISSCVLVVLAAFRPLFPGINSITCAFVTLFRGKIVGAFRTLVEVNFAGYQK